MRDRALLVLGLLGCRRPIPMMATAGMACLPVLALYLVLQRQIVNGFVRSCLK